MLKVLLSIDIRRAFLVSGTVSSIGMPVLVLFVLAPAAWAPIIVFLVDGVEFSTTQATTA
jgi:hypothetical protein